MTSQCQIPQGGEGIAVNPPSIAPYMLKGRCNGGIDW